MTRTQTGDAGTFHAGVIYEPNAKTKAALAHYIKRGFAERLTQEEVDALTAAANPAGDPAGTGGPAKPAADKPEKPAE
ncbi:hypothetical protein [Mameliella sediminis]|uniref:hypothetical protein n=1 Tax=Mameliella sediminis TaxID=2836866 RepID=UPI001C446DE0|nr:hypothetical protein [Mameliella sediminis]MBV7394560.1 hypothetical protein [Mameliella sediminis]